MDIDRPGALERIAQAFRVHPAVALVGPRQCCKEDSASVLWRQSFERTFLDRDIPQLGVSIPAETLRRFWTMVAHHHGEIWNASEFARAMGRPSQSLDATSTSSPVPTWSACCRLDTRT